jgi:hypothetical protein
MDITQSCALTAAAFYLCDILASNFDIRFSPGFFRAVARFRFQFIERLKGTILMNGS